MCVWTLLQQFAPKTRRGVVPTQCLCAVRNISSELWAVFFPHVNNFFLIFRRSKRHHKFPPPLFLLYKFHKSTKTYTSPLHPFLKPTPALDRVLILALSSILYSIKTPRPPLPILFIFYDLCTLKKNKKTVHNSLLISARLCDHVPRRSYRLKIKSGCLHSVGILAPTHSKHLKPRASSVWMAP